MNKELLDSFIEQYHSWTATYKQGHHLSQELSFYLEQKRKRLENKKLQLNENYEHLPDEINGCIPRSEEPYEAKIFYREASHRLSYTQNGKLIKEYKEPVVFYATFLNKKGYEDELHTCPNCGHQFKTAEISRSCPYCGTYFENLEHYPYVTSFYSVPAIVERNKLQKNLKKIVLIPAVIIGVIVLIVSLIRNPDYPLLLRLFIGFFSAFFAGGMAAVYVYLLYSLFLLSRLFYEAFRSLKLLGGLNSGRKLQKLLKNVDPKFSYEYFEGRLITLFRSIAFADQRSNLSIYSGTDDLSFLDDVIDLSYRGSSALKDFRIEDGIIHITMKVFMQVIRSAAAIERKDENYLITLKKKAVTNDLGFRINKVQCRNCGATFDALHQKNCPHCSTPYELYQDDWMIEKIAKA